MYEKTLWEKIGDLLSHPGKRFLIGLLSVIILGPFGVMIALSVLENQKTYFVANVMAKTKSGRVIPCTIIKRKCYAYMPVFPFFCPFYYFPYKTEYCLIKNLSTNGIEPNQAVNDTPLLLNLVRYDKITKAYATAMQSSLLTLKNEDETAPREEFLKDVEPFFKAGVLKEVYCTDQFSVCALKGDLVIFHYVKDPKPKAGQNGFNISDDYVEKVKNDTSILLSVYLTATPQKLLNCTVELTDAALERLIRNSENEDSKASREVLEDADKEKTPLTNEMIKNQLTSKSATSKSAWGWVLAIFALGGIELGIAGMVTGMIPLGIIFLAVGIWCAYLSIKKIRTGKSNRNKIQNNGYTVLKVECTEATERIVESDEGDSYYYDITFANGYSVTLNKSIGIKGDSFYLATLDGEKEVGAFYNATYYSPAPDLVFEEYSKTTV